MTENNESILRRVEKLLAIARHERSNPQEAASAAAMAANVMRKYQISEGDVLINKLKGGEELASEHIIPTLATWNDVLKRIPLWAGRLGVAVALLTETQVVVQRVTTAKGSEVALVFRGFIPDVKLAIYIMSFLQTNIRRLRSDFTKTYTYKEQGLSSLRSYTDGLTFGIISALEAMRVANQEEELASASASSGTSLTIVKTNAIEEKFGGVKYNKSSSVNFAKEGFVEGWKDGKDIKINTAIEGDSSAKMIEISLSA